MNNELKKLLISNIYFVLKCNKHGFSIFIIKEKINLDYIGDYDDTEFEDDDEDEDDPDYEDFRFGDDDDDGHDLSQKWFISLFY